MAYTTIDNPAEYFNTVIYTGTGSSLSVTGVGFQSDFRWLKQRSYVGYHQFNDTLRGITKYLFSNATDAEYTDADGFTAIGSDGFTVGTNAGFNTNGGTLVAWNWLAGGTGVSNTAGTITSTVSANTTSGFSVGKTTGTLSSGDITVGHGMGIAPSMILWKRTDGASSWQVYHKSLGINGLLQLNTTGSAFSSTYWGTPTSTTFTVKNSLYGSGETYGFYCFAEVKGYSKAFSYTGNGSTDGSYVHLGFKPAFVISKGSSLASSWNIHDDKRQTFNDGSIPYFKANTSDAELSATNMDFLSNGFKLRTTDNDWNGSGQTYIGIAFATNPFVSSTGIPTTAR